jgi:catechol 2,3-dioxygenase-like lactoylglutathione lyase family enzyme
MKLNSISGLAFYVADPAKTAEFYESLGFFIEKREADYVMIRLNWFWAEFRKGQASPGGPLVYVSVADIDEFYQGVIVRHIQPDGEPKEYSGRREFSLVDPDGYKLVFFQKAK